MTDLKFYLEKSNGTWRNFNGLLEALERLQGGRWVVQISKYKKKRSLSQNAYYHSCIIPAVKDGLINMGFDASSLSNETVHELLKSKFLKEDLANENGEFITIVKSTTELSTVDFMAYIEDIYRWSAEFLNIVIPEPGQQSEMF